MNHKEQTLYSNQNTSPSETPVTTSALPTIPQIFSAPNSNPVRSNFLNQNSPTIKPNTSKKTAKTNIKDARINIRLSSNQLEQIKAVAAQSGLPYQTFITSLLHRYLTGQLIEKSN